METSISSDVSEPIRARTSLAVFWDQTRSSASGLSSFSEVVETRPGRATHGRRRWQLYGRAGRSDPARSRRSLMRPNRAWHVPVSSREQSPTPPRAPRYGHRLGRDRQAQRGQCVLPNARIHARDRQRELKNARTRRAADSAFRAARRTFLTSKRAPPALSLDRSRTAAARTAPWRASRSRRGAVPQPAAARARTATASPAFRHPQDCAAGPASIREGRTGSYLPNWLICDRPQDLCWKRHAHKNNAFRIALPGLRHRHRRTG